ncbi:hypothetical protein BDV95DRAFT_591633 [Massariosphaeria phaeospora]|uniref:SPT2 chromatin protein-domain-containing protein n=1 Tax=Massariosphaeria phaeospora TaxID=100035 RepID=A0A7C8MED2_9PLEO|nr:hypothetical protein BDV95DRAFT_591633 [Massariosphaeria phaeospora]
MSTRITDLLQEINPGTATLSPVPASKPTQPIVGPNPAPRPVTNANGAAPNPMLKRKASGQVEGAQVKIQRKDVAVLPHRPNGPTRPKSTQDVAAPKPSALPAAVPYRGTAGLNAGRVTTVAKKPPPGTSQAVPAKVPVVASKTAMVAPTVGASPAPTKRNNYAAMMAKAKVVQETKPAPPPLKHEPTKILTKKEREALRAGANASNAAAKGKKPGTSGLARSAGPKVDAVKEKRKPAELGYQGTARPTKKPAELAYRGTAKPSTIAGPAGKTGSSTAAKAKAKSASGRYGGYASWSDDEMAEEEDEDDYESDVSDMEGGLWDVEEEETLALKVAKKEDALALAEENELKRQKEEKRRKLEQLAAKAKRRY